MRLAASLLLPRSCSRYNTLTAFGLGLDRGGDKGQFVLAETVQLVLALVLVLFALVAS